MARRILYLDLLRGFFIFYVTLIHGIAQFVLHADANVTNELPRIVMIILTPFIILASWAPIFALVSGTANGFVMMQAASKLDPKLSWRDQDLALLKIIKGPLINSMLLYLFSFINVYFFHYGINIGGTIHYSTITGSIELGNLQWGDTFMFFFSDAISLMAISGVIVCVLTFFLWRNHNQLNIKRNVIILTLVALVWFFISPFLHAELEPLFFSSIEEKNYGMAYLLKILIGPTESTFPNAAYAIFGEIFGFALAIDAPIKRIRQYGYGFGCSFLLTAIIWMLVTNTKFALGPENIGKALPFNVHLIDISLMLLLSTFLIDIMEYQTPEKRVIIARNTTFLRRYGLIALTIFLLEGLVSISLKKLFYFLWPWLDSPILNFPMVGVYLLTLLAIWYIIARLWEKVDFKYSFEWLLVQVAGRLRGRLSSKLHVEEVLYNPVQIAKDGQKPE
jgi:hypothetical protein